MPSESSALWMNRVGMLIPFGIAILVTSLLVPAIFRAREAARRMQSKNNLKQFGLALSNYNDAFNMLPPGGTFDLAGTGHHGWTTFLEPYLAACPWHIFVDYNVPWDDSRNIDLFLTGGFAVRTQNPCMPEQKSPDGFPLSHYAANQNLMYRNSSVRLRDLTDTGQTVLLGDANGSYVPLGYPFNWRDLSMGLGTSKDGFGCPSRETTMLLMADGSVRSLVNSTDAVIVKAFAAEPSAKPTADEIAKPAEPYRLKSGEFPRFRYQVRDDRQLMTFNLSPDRKHLRVNFGRYENPERAEVQYWQSTFDSLATSATLEHVELLGRLRAKELLPFLGLRHLKRLTISEATVEDDRKTLLENAPKSLVID